MPCHSLPQRACLGRVFLRWKEMARLANGWKSQQVQPEDFERPVGAYWTWGQDAPFFPSGESVHAYKRWHQTCSPLRQLQATRLLPILRSVLGPAENVISEELARLGCKAVWIISTMQRSKASEPGRSRTWQKCSVPLWWTCWDPQGTPSMSEHFGMNDHFPYLVCPALSCLLVLLLLQETNRT